jgi:membrane protease YdiL (CAAX protease family)
MSPTQKSSLKSLMFPEFVGKSLPYNKKTFLKVITIWFKSLPFFLVLVVITRILTIGSKNLNELNSFVFPLGTVLEVVIFAPVIEEVFFRGWLTDKKSVLFASILLVFFYFGINLQGWVIVAIAIILLAVLFHLGSTINNLVQRNYLFLFYFTSIVFGLIHISNFENLKVSWILYPLVTGPQIMFGFIAAHIRNHYGLKYALFYHAWSNGVLITISLILLALASK